ncbi:MAG: glycosyltransferase family 2 protein, partial [Myxococcales bacterium]
MSLVIPVYNEEVVLPLLHPRLQEFLTRLALPVEVIFVNDGSKDRSLELLRVLAAEDPRYRVVSLARNFGHQAAITAGLDYARGEAVVVMDADLQDPPEVVVDMVAKWKEGYDVVYGRRVKREATPFMQLAYKSFYRVFDWFSYVRIPHDAGDFSLLDRRVVDGLLQFPERDLFLRGLRAFAGFRQTGVDYVRPERMFGTTTNSLARNLGWAKKGILSFSNTPLNILSFAG